MKTAHCDKTQDVAAFALHALDEGEASMMHAHVASCAQCREELDSLRPLTAALGSWPADILSPSSSLQSRLASRIAREAGGETFHPTLQRPAEIEWDEVAPGLFCKVLSQDAPRQRVSMLVKLLPSVEYPPHTHADLEELFLLDDELWIDDRKLFAGDYSRAEAGTGDKRVWSETGCTCVLITSMEDAFA